MGPLVTTVFPQFPLTSPKPPLLHPLLLPLLLPFSMELPPFSPMMPSFTTVLPPFTMELPPFSTVLPPFSTVLPLFSAMLPPFLTLHLLPAQFSVHPQLLLGLVWPLALPFSEPSLPFPHLSELPPVL